MPAFHPGTLNSRCSAESNRANVFCTAWVGRRIEITPAGELLRERCDLRDGSHRQLERLVSGCIRTVERKRIVAADTLVRRICPREKRSVERRVGLARNPGLYADSHRRLSLEVRVHAHRIAVAPHLQPQLLPGGRGPFQVLAFAGIDRVGTLGDAAGEGGEIFCGGNTEAEGGELTGHKGR